MAVFSGIVKHTTSKLVTPIVQFIAREVGARFIAPVLWILRLFCGYCARFVDITSVLSCPMYYAHFIDSALVELAE